MSENTRNKIIKMVRDGVDRKVIREETGIPSSTITKIMREAKNPKVEKPKQELDIPLMENAEQVIDVLIYACKRVNTYKKFNYVDYALRIAHKWRCREKA